MNKTERHGLEKQSRKQDRIVFIIVAIVITLLVVGSIIFVHYGPTAQLDKRCQAQGYDAWHPVKDLCYKDVGFNEDTGERTYKYAELIK